MHLDYKVSLRNLTNTLLSPEASFDEMFYAAEQLYQLFLTAASMDTEDLQNKTDLFLPHGKAIAPAWAAMCIKDFYRTRQFLRGMILGIQSALQSFPGTPIHVVYAGSGPFATLALPLTSVFSPEQVQFTLVEINPISVAMLHKVVATCRAQAYIRAIVEADATTYRVCSPVHMVVTETMEQALQDEPQVAITQNLAAQMVEGGILIPQRVAIHAGFLNLAKTLEINVPDDIRRLTGLVFDLTHATPSANEEGIFPEVIIDFPENVETGFSQFCLFTDIHIFGNIHLGMAESGLTQPKILLQTGQHGKFNVRRIGLQYTLRSKPGFKMRIIR